MTVSTIDFGAMSNICLARFSGRYAAPLKMNATELRSVFFVFGLLTNWCMTEGTKNKPVIRYLVNDVSGHS